MLAQQQSRLLEFGIAVTQSLPAATQPLLHVGSNTRKGSPISSSTPARARMAAGCWVDAWVAHVMTQPAVMLVTLTTSCGCVSSERLSALAPGGEQWHDAMLGHACRGLQVRTLALPCPPAQVVTPACSQTKHAHLLPLLLWGLQARAQQQAGTGSMQQHRGREDSTEC